MDQKMKNCVESTFDAERIVTLILQLNIAV